MSAGKYRKEKNCLNCGHEVEEHYCSSCGQPNLELKENFWQFISHSIAHYFHFDNKFFQTLTPLLTKPGKVTLDYLAGKRARYINPVSMYIFVSIVYFLVAFSDGTKKKEKKAQRNYAAAEAVDERILDSIPSVKSNGRFNKYVEEGKNELKAALLKKRFKQTTFTKQDAILTSMKTEMKLNKSDSINDLYRSLNAIHIERNDSTYEAYLTRQNKLPALEKDSWFDKMVKKRSIEIGVNGEKIQEQLERNRPKQFFLFMPLMALFVMLNFRRNHIYYLDHLIFTIHGMTAFFLVQIFTNPFIDHLFGKNTIMAAIVELGVLVWLVWYMYNSLKVFYNRSKKATIWRMVWISLLYGTAYKITELIVVNAIYYAGVAH